MSWIKSLQMLLGGLVILGAIIILTGCGKSETEAWTTLNSIESAASGKETKTQIAMYESYVKEWRGTEAANKAQSTLTELKRIDEDDTAWSVAKSANTRESYSTYLASHPEGRHRTEATQTQRPQFTATNDGVITDSLHNLNWCVGPDSDTDYAAAVRWVQNLSVGGGGWRMPTRTELRTLYAKGVGDRNMSPGFKTTGWFVWTGDQTEDSSSAWIFFFTDGHEGRGGRDCLKYGRVFAVRSRR